MPCTLPLPSNVKPLNSVFLAIVLGMVCSGVSYGFSLVNILSMLLVSDCDDTFGL